MSPNLVTALREWVDAGARVAELLEAEPAEKEFLSMREAADAAGWTYDTFRKERAFDAANVAPPNRRKRYARSRLLQIARSLKPA